MSTIAQAYVQIVPSADGIQGSLTNLLGGEADSAGNSAGESFGANLIGKVKGLIAAAGIGAALKEAVDQGASLEQSIGGVETLFKDSADTVKKYADQAYETVGVSANDYMSSVTSFSAALLSGLGGDTAKAAEVANMAMVDMSDNANKMGTDMGSIQTAYQGFAKQNYTMLDNLKLGYGGTKTEMARLLEDAEKISGVHYDMNNLADVYNAIHVIQGGVDDLNGGVGDVNKGLGITGTTAREASVTVEGSMNAMKAAFSNLLGNMALGEDLEPSLTALTDTVMTFVNQNLIPMVGRIIASIPSMLSGVLSGLIGELNVVANNADQIVEMGIQFVTELTTALISAAPYLAEAAINLVLALGEALLTADWATIGSNMISEISENMDVAAGEILGTDGSIIDGVISAITSGLPNLLQSGIEIIASLCESITAALPTVLQVGIEIIMKIVTGVLQNLPQIITAAGQVMTVLVSTLLQNLPVVWTAAKDLLFQIGKGIIDNLPEIAIAAGKVIIQLIATIGENLPTVLQTGIEILGQLAAGLIDAIPELLSKVPEIFKELKKAFEDVDWGSIGANIMEGIAKGIKNAIGAVKEAAADAASGAVDTLKDLLGIHSPSRVMRDEVGVWIPEGVAQGIVHNISPIDEAMSQVKRAMSATVRADVATAVSGGMRDMSRLQVANSTGIDRGFNQYLTINSPRELTPSEVARQTRNATRNMVLAMRGN